VAGTANGNSWSRVERPSELGEKERLAWVDDGDNSAVIRRVGEAVLNREDPATIAWALPKDPYQFVAARPPLFQALYPGPSFETRLPLTFDGSCSGLQHMCGMMRAEEGRFVNLTSDEEFDDFYRRVTFGVAEFLHAVMYDVRYRAVNKGLPFQKKTKEKIKWIQDKEAPLVALDYDIVSGDDDWVRNEDGIAQPCHPVQFQTEYKQPPDRRTRRIFSEHPFQWLIESPFARDLGKPTGMTYF